MIQDRSGNLLETFENYNDLYCLHELLPNNRLNTEGPGTFYGEGLVLPGANTLGVDVNVGAALQAVAGDDGAAVTALLAVLKDIDPFNETINYDPLN